MNPRACSPLVENEALTVKDGAPVVNANALTSLVIVVAPGFSCRASRVSGEPAPVTFSDASKNGGVAGGGQSLPRIVRSSKSPSARHAVTIAYSGS
jgi:hypothetical protein